MNPREFCREKGFSSAILLTYNFDPIFFERVARRDLWTGDTGDILVLADRNQIAQLSTRWEGQLRELGRRYQLATATTLGAFHPKMMLRIGQQGGAVWLASGNLTAGGWGGNHELATAWTIGPNRADDGAWLLQLLQRISSWSPDNLHHNVIRRVLETPWVERLEGRSLSDNGRTILTSHLNQSLASQLLVRWQGRRFTEALIYTGSSDEGGAFLRWLHDSFGIKRSTVVASESNLSFLRRKIDGLPIKTTIKRPTQIGTLHAKFYWLTGPDGPAAIMGSANCSAAAWLLPPSAGGNIEAVAVYDQPNASDFESVLALFRSDDLITVALSNKRRVSPRETGATGPIISEVAWSDDLGRIMVVLKPSRFRTDEVLIGYRGKSIRMHRLGSSDLQWFAEIPLEMVEGQTTFVVLTLRYDNQCTWSAKFWVNDLNELRHASHGRRLIDSLNALAEATNSSEQKQIVTTLHRIGQALLSEPESFPDPSFTPSASSNEHKTRQWKAVIPEEFVKSLDEIDLRVERASAGGLGRSLSLTGIMRALFNLERVENFDEEADYTDEGEGEAGKRKRRSNGKGKATPSRPTSLPDERYRQKLHSLTEDFVYKLGEKQFSDTCTASQLVQSAAFPIAIAMFGVQGGWLASDLARDWAIKIFDTLFRQDNVGLIQKVLERYRADDREEDFFRIAGDGTLWLALLIALASPSWSGEHGPFEKALALRDVLHSNDLIASAESGRMGALIARLDESRARAIMKVAPRAASSLNEIEQILSQKFQSLLERQKGNHVSNNRGDLLWNPGAGWAECQGSSSWGENLDAYLHFRADVKLISTKYFVNVSKATLGGLKKLFARLESL